MRPSESGATGRGAFGFGFAMAGAKGGEAEVGRGAAARRWWRGINATTGGFSMVAENRRKAVDDDISGFCPMREAEWGDHVGKEGFYLGGRDEWIKGVTKGNAVSSGEGIDDTDGAEVVALSKLMGGESAVVE